MLWEVLGAVVIFFIGVFFHFLYKYGGKKRWMAIISPVNESIWEHLKLTFYPVLVYTIIEFFIIKELPQNYLLAETLGIYVTLLSTLVIEIVYPSVVKKNIFVLDLVVFFLAITVGQLFSYFFMTRYSETNLPVSYSIAILGFQTGIFALFSFFPPRIPLFRDSVDGKYGIK